MVALTATATVAYVAAPFDASPNERADTGRPGMVEPAHRIVAVRADGSLAVLDAEDGGLSEVVVPAPGTGIDAIEAGSDREAAYVVRPGETIDLIRLKTGTDERWADGRSVSLGPVAFPQLARTTPRPEVERLAFVVPGEDGDEIIVENHTTGDRRRIDAAGPGGRPFTTIDDLVLSPVGNRLFGVADGGTTVFRIDLDRMSTLSQAVTSTVPEGGRIIDATAFGDGLAAVVRSPAGDAALVEIERRSLTPGQLLLSEDATTDLRTVDADARAAGLLLVTGDSQLLVLEPAIDDAPRLLADGVRLAAW